MSEILLCNRPLSGDELHAQCGLSLADVSGNSCQRPTKLQSHTPYIVSGQPTALDNVLMMQLGEPATARSLTDLSLTFGGDNTVALAKLTANLNSLGTGAMGAATSAYGGRVDAFGKAVQNYQSALLHYRSTVASGGAAKQAAEIKTRNAFAAMQQQFQQELKLTAGRATSRRGKVLAHPQRGINIARSSRSAVKLDVMSKVEASDLRHFAKHAKVLGNGLAVVDFGSRIGNIHTTYRADGNWERELFVESTSFAASAVVGTLAVKGGLALLMVATPVGWAGLIVGGIAVAGAAAGASFAVNSELRKNSGSWYDAIMKKLGV